MDSKVGKRDFIGLHQLNALEKAVEKDMNDKKTSWNWEMNLEEPCLGLNQRNVATATKGKVSAMVCFATLEEVVGKEIMDATELDKIKGYSDEDHLKK
jgi:hypothetical protein